MSEQTVNSSDIDSSETEAPFVVVDGRRVRIAVVDHGLIPPWDGFSLRKWWRKSWLNLAKRPTPTK